MIKLVEVLPDIGSGGAEKLVTDLLLNFDSNKFDVTLVLLFDERGKYYYELLKNRGINIITLNKKPGFDIKCFFRMNKILKKLKPDIIHTHRYVNLYILPYYIFHRKQTGFHTVHSLAENELEKMHRKITYWLFHHRKVFPVAISNICMESVLNYYRLPSSQVQTIYNGVDLDRFINDRTVRKVRNFIAVGRMTAPKNYPLMLRVFSELVRRFPECTLTVLGEGELFEDMLRLKSELGLDSSVVFTGVVTNVGEYMAKADCLLMSSDYEGLPLTVLEAMAAGLPIVSTRAGGIADIVIENENGFLSDIGDADGLLNNLVKIVNMEDCGELSEKSVELAENYSIKKCVNGYEKLFEQSVSGKTNE